ncbi:MAG: ABC transporter ATP-binding protein [Gemmatimonadales bacterium]
MSVLARLQGVERRFGRVRALAGADLEVRAGEVHAVLGENGAGKSTLLGVLGGLVRPDAGSLEIDGAPAVLDSPRAAWARGIGLVHQHFMLVPSLTVLENLALGSRRPARAISLDLDRIAARASTLMQRTGLLVPLQAPVDTLAVGQKQRVEILRTLLRDPRMVALDEPTAALAPAETAALFVLLRRLAAEGRAVVLVAHKIDEILGVADHVTVLRKGRTVLSEPRARVDAGALVRAMVGGEPVSRELVGAAGEERPDARPQGARVASLQDVVVRDASGRVALDGATLAVHRGEIVGVAGIEGSGQRELALVLAARREPDGGVASLPAGIGFIPQDRTSEGLIGDFDLVENVALALHSDPRAAGRVRIRWDAVRDRAEDVRARFGLVAPGVSVAARTLSGGNQQRLVVGRELLVAADLLVAENPARGLDVSATAFVHTELRRVTRTPDGPGVVLVSNDLDEALAMSDRLFVVSRGRLLPVPADRRTREGVGALMLGGVADA